MVGVVVGVSVGLAVGVSVGVVVGVSVGLAVGVSVGVVVGVSVATRIVNPVHMLEHHSKHPAEPQNAPASHATPASPLL